MSIENNLMVVYEKIKKAADRVNRNFQDIQLVAVTKTIPVEAVEKALSLGIKDVGENRVQELLQKHEIIGDKVKWHMIGHLQKNKVKYIIDKVEMIHSLDSYELAEEINKRAKAVNRKIQCLLQVNISNEETKFGIKKEKAEELLLKAEELQYVNIAGLMTMAPYTDESEKSRVYFKALRRLSEEISTKIYKNTVMKHLSMGMSNDYEVAIEEGATLIRIGSAIFEER